MLNSASERFEGYTTKTYNLLALTLMRKNDIESALKIFQNAVSKLDLDGEGKALLSSCNQDLECLLYNYLKCICLKRGQGQEFHNFAKNDAEATKVLGYMSYGTMNAEFLAERQSAAAMFDSAV